MSKRVQQNLSSSSEGKRTTKKKRARSRLARVVVGLGNPGPRYDGSRHNAGFEVVKRLANSRSWVSTSTFDVAHVTVRSRPVHLTRPTTYMNDSGVAVRDVLKRFGCSVSDLIVLVDDINLDVGRIRIRGSGSDGGHNGLASISSLMRSDDYVRVRLGVGTVPDDSSQIDFVLGQFEKNEFSQVSTMFQNAADAVRSWCSDGVGITMNLFNGR